MIKCPQRACNKLQLLAALFVRTVYACRWTKHGVKWSDCHCGTWNTGRLSWNWSVWNISSL